MMLALPRSLREAFLEVSEGGSTFPDAPSTDGVVSVDAPRPIEPRPILTTTATDLVAVQPEMQPAAGPIGTPVLRVTPAVDSGGSMVGDLVADDSTAAAVMRADWFGVPREAVLGGALLVVILILLLRG